MVRYQPPKDWQQWVEWLAAGLHGRSRWRLSLILIGMLFARGRRTVTTWPRAVGIKDDFADYYYFLQPLGSKSKEPQNPALSKVNPRAHSRQPSNDRAIRVAEFHDRKVPWKKPGAGPISRPP